MPSPRASIELNARQREAVEHDPAAGPLLVVAGAGTGKTATLAARAAWLVRECGVSLERMLLVTFSRRAALEMQRRVGRLLQQDLGLPDHLPPPRLPWCGTFHGVAARLLREEAPQLGLPAGFTVLDRGDAEDLMALVRQREGLAEGERRFPLAATCLALHSRQVNTRAPLAAVLEASHPWCRDREADLERLFAAYGAAKRAQRSLDFDDLLLAWWQLMREPAYAERLRTRFTQVLVDEVQDVNRLQADIVHALAPGGRGVTVVGDDAQSIYAFRGADVRHILDFPARYDPPARVIKLEQNYRSSAPLLAASNAVIALAAERWGKTLWTSRAGSLKPRLLTVADEAAQAEGVAGAVLEARERGLALKRQAVLFRSASHSAALEFELLRRRIPFVKYGGLRFFDSAHVKDLLALLRWADNPHAALSALRVARLVAGLGPASQRRLAEHPHELAAFAPPRAALEAWGELRALIEHLRSPHARWPDDLARALAWYRPQLERLHDDARTRLADLDQLVRIAATHTSRERFLTELALDPPQAGSDEAGEPLRDEDYLVLSTLHSAKGQEWNAVHILGVVDGCLPADLATGSTAEIEEERRLLYVGMTRARDELALWVPQRFYVTQQRSRGDRHVYALRSRFVPEALLAHFDVITAGAERAPQLDLMALLRDA